MSALPKYSPQGEFTTVDEDTYRVRFTDYTEPKEGGYGSKFSRLTFQIEDPESEFHGEKISDNFGWTMTEGSKLHKVIKALYGKEIDEETDIDIEELKGKATCRLTIEHVEKPNPENPRQPRIFYKVVGASAIKKKARAAAPPPPPPDDEEEAEDDPF